MRERNGNVDKDALLAEDLLDGARDLVDCKFLRTSEAVGLVYSSLFQSRQRCNSGNIEDRDRP